jgi:hypothetical protein
VLALTDGEIAGTTLNLVTADSQINAPAPPRRRGRDQ